MGKKKAKYSTRTLKTQKQFCRRPLVWWTFFCKETQQDREEQQRKQEPENKLEHRKEEQWEEQALLFAFLWEEGL